MDSTSEEPRPADVSPGRPEARKSADGARTGSSDALRPWRVTLGAVLVAGLGFLIHLIGSGS